MREWTTPDWLSSAGGGTASLSRSFTLPPSAQLRWFPCGHPKNREGVGSVLRRHSFREVASARWGFVGLIWLFRRLAMTVILWVLLAQ